MDRCQTVPERRPLSDSGGGPRGCLGCERSVVPSNVLAKFAARRTFQQQSRDESLHASATECAAPIRTLHDLVMSSLDGGEQSPWLDDALCLDPAGIFGSQNDIETQRPRAPSPAIGLAAGKIIASA